MKFNCNCQTNAGFLFEGVNATAFSGKMRFTYGNTAVSHITHFDGFSFGGTAELVNKTFVSPVGTGGATISNITVAAEGGIILTENASITVIGATFADGASLTYPSTRNTKPLIVTGTLTLAGSVRLPEFELTTNDMTQVALVRVPAGKPIDESKFILPDNHVGMMVNTGLSVVEADGWKTLYANYRRVVKLIKSNTSYETSCFLPAYAPECWSDRQEISSNNVYYADGDATLHVPNTNLFVFGGASLVLGTNVQFLAKTVSNAKLLFPSLVMSGGSHFEYFGNKLAIDGDLAVIDGVATMFARNDVEYVISATMSGDGTLRLCTGYKSQSGPGAVLLNPRSRYTIGGDNSAFSGRVLVTTPSPVYTSNDNKAAEIPVGPDDTYCAKLWISSASNLGGQRASFMYDALRLENYSQLNVTNNITLSEPSLGICAADTARINVADGCVFTLADTAVTFDGVLRKEGVGMLALGGPARFTDGAAGTAPVPGHNVLRVEGGALKPISTNCLDGVACVFSSGTTLIYDLVPTAPGMAMFGPVNVREPGGTPFALASGASAVEVVFATPAEIPCAGIVALGTFASAEIAEGVKGLMHVNSPEGRSVDTVVRTNQDGTATLVVSWRHPGLIISVK